MRHLGSVGQSEEDGICTTFRERTFVYQRAEIYTSIKQREPHP